MDANMDGSTWAPEHTTDIFNPAGFQALIRKMVPRVRKLQIELGFQALAASGNSGLLIVGALAARLKMPMLIVRKSMDTDNDSRMVNGFVPKIPNGSPCKYLIIDDLVSTGRTVVRIVKHIDTQASKSVGFIKRPICAGVLLYQATGRTRTKNFVDFDQNGRAIPNFELPLYFLRSR